ncbi:MAG: helix-hairpin-helix domain-containing protein [Phycisphaerales bacterium]
MASKPTDVIEDWTYGPLRWICAGLVIGAAAVGMAWSIAERRTTAPSRPQLVQADSPGTPQPAKQPEATASVHTEEKGSSTPKPAFVTEVPPRDVPVAAPPKQGPASVSAKPLPVNLNNASLQQLEELPGIGPSLAARIVEDRLKFGRYKTVQDLDRVKGIGPKLLEKLRPLVVAE